MGTVSVMVNDKHLFDWEGDKTSVQEILEKFPREAEVANMTSEEFANTVISQLAAGLRPSTDPVATMAVMWRILTRESRDPKRPGLVGDYVPNGTLAACIDKVGLGYSLEVAIADNEVVQ